MSCFSSRERASFSAQLHDDVCCCCSFREIICDESHFIGLQYQLQYHVHLATGSRSKARCSHYQRCAGRTHRGISSSRLHFQHVRPHLCAHKLPALYHGYAGTCLLMPSLAWDLDRSGAVKCLAFYTDRSCMFKLWAYQQRHWSERVSGYVLTMPEGGNCCMHQACFACAGALF